MANWWDTAPLAEEPPSTPPAGGGDWFASAPAVEPETPQPATEQPKSLTQAATDRLRYVNDVMTLGGWDRIQAAARSLVGGTPFQQAYQEEAGRTRAARESLSVPEQIGYGLVGSAPLAAAGGALGLLGRGASAVGAPTASAALQQAATVAAPTLGRRAAIGAAEAGLQGATEAAIKGQDIGTGAATGMALGAGLPVALSAAGRAISPLRSQLTTSQQQLAQEAAERGLQLTPAQATGSRAAQFFESQLRDLPGGGLSPRPQQQQALQEQALRSAGVFAPDATPGNIAGGFSRIGQEFDQILTGRNVRFDKQFDDGVTDAIREYGNTLPRDVRGIFRSQVEELFNQPRSLDGRTANNLRSNLSRLEREYKNEPRLQAAISALREQVDKAISRSLPEEARKQLRTARNQYKNLSRIDEVMSRAGPQAESGQIPFVQLNNLIKQRSGSVSRGISAASPEFEKLAQIGSTFFREPQSSGTAQRNYITALLTGGIGAGSLLAGGLPGLAAAVGTPLATNLVYNRPLMQRLLSQQAGRALERVPQQAMTGAGTAGIGLLGQ